MIEGRPRESLVMYESPIEVSNSIKNNQLFNRYTNLLLYVQIGMGAPQKSFGKFNE